MAQCDPSAVICRTGARRWRWLLAAATLLPCTIALAQPVAPADLRREIEKLQAENQRLATQVEDLTARLGAAEAARDEATLRAEALATELERLRQGQPSTATGSPSPQAPVAAEPPAPIPVDPMASPASLLRELQRRYGEAFAHDDAGESQPSPLTVSARRALESWCVEQSRSLRGEVRWRVRFTALRPLGRNERSVMLAVLDPESDRPIGEALEIAVPRQFADRLARELGPTGGDDKSPPWTLVGTLTARPALNPDRPTPGVFNHPVFVGPFVEFGFDLRWESVTPVAPAPREPAPDEG